MDQARSAERLALSAARWGPEVSVDAVTHGPRRRFGYLALGGLILSVLAAACGESAPSSDPILLDEKFDSADPAFAVESDETLDLLVENGEYVARFRSAERPHLMRHLLDGSYDSIRFSATATDTSPGRAEASMAIGCWSGDAGYVLVIAPAGAVLLEVVSESRGDRRPISPFTPPELIPARGAPVSMMLDCTARDDGSTRLTGWIDGSVAASAEVPGVVDSFDAVGFWIGASEAGVELRFDDARAERDPPPPPEASAPASREQSAATTTPLEDPGNDRLSVPCRDPEKVFHFYTTPILDSFGTQCGALEVGEGHSHRASYRNGAYEVVAFDSENAWSSYVDLAPPETSISIEASVQFDGAGSLAVICEHSPTTKYWFALIANDSIETALFRHDGSVAIQGATLPLEHSERSRVALTCSITDRGVELQALVDGQLVADLIDEDPMAGFTAIDSSAFVFSPLPGDDQATFRIDDLAITSPG